MHAQGELKKYAFIINNSGRNLLRILNDLLDFSKIEAGKLSIELQEFQFSLLLENAVDLFAAKARAKNLEIKLKYHSDLKDIFLGDGTRIAQVLHNFIGNAIKFTEKGEILILATSKNSKDRKRIVEVQVKDTGIGIPKEKINQLFEPFNQMDTFKGALS